jgi:hypothetical protein
MPLLCHSVGGCGVCKIYVVTFASPLMTTTREVVSGAKPAGRNAPGDPWDVKYNRHCSVMLKHPRICGRQKPSCLEKKAVARHFYVTYFGGPRENSLTPGMILPTVPWRHRACCSVRCVWGILKASSSIPALVGINGWSRIPQIRRVSRDSAYTFPIIGTGVLLAHGSVTFIMILACEINVNN